MPSSPSFSDGAATADAPTAWPAVHREAIAHRLAGRYPRMLEVLRTHLMANQDDALAWALLAHACMLTGRAAQAEPPLKRALALAPRDEGVLRAAVAVLLMQGCMTEAERVARALADRNPGDPDNQLTLAQVLDTQGRLDEAWERVNHVLSVAPGHAEGLAQGATIALRRNDAAVAAVMLDQALERAPDLFVAQALRARLRPEIKGRGAARPVKRPKTPKTPPTETLPTGTLPAQADHLPQSNLPQSNLIGFLMYPTKPNFVEVNALAEACHRQGLSVIYMSYKNCRVEAGRVKGYVYDHGKWVAGDSVFPWVIDNAPPKSDAHRAVYRELRKRAFLTFHRPGGKDVMLPLLAGDPRSAGFAIPSEELSVDGLRRALDTYGQAVVKPYSSNRGRNVYRIARAGTDTFLLECDQERTVLDEAGLHRLLADRSAGPYMLQPYIRSVDEEGRPFDIRVPVFRGQNGVWGIPRVYARCGAGSITSNLATGGSAYDAAPFLSRLYGEKAGAEIAAKVERAALTITEVMQENYNFMIDALGCDFGIADGEIYLFEVNSYPGIKGCLENAVARKVDFYRFLLRRASLHQGSAFVNKSDLFKKWL